MLEMLLTDMDILEAQKADIREFAMLWRARLKFQLDQHLSSSVTNLKDASIGLYKEYIEKVRQASKQDKSLQNTLALLLIEQFYCLLHFFKYEKAEAALKEAQDIIDLKISMEGKLGKRTRFQKNDIAQLTVDFESRKVKLKVNEENDGLAESTETEGVFKPDEETQKFLDGESIYWKGGRPLLKDGQQDRELSETDLILITAHTFYLFRTLPKDEHREEILRPFV